jgi:hypothetical protein
MSKDAPRGLPLRFSWRCAAPWLLTLTIQGCGATLLPHIASAHGAPGTPVTGTGNTHAPDAASADEKNSALLSPGDVSGKEARILVRERMREYFDKLPATLRKSWWDAFKEAGAAERTLYAQVTAKKDELETKAFKEIAKRLGVSTITDLYVHTEGDTGIGKDIKHHYVIEPLTDFIRRGQDFVLRNTLSVNANDFIKHSRVNRHNSESKDTDLDVRKVIEVLADYDAAGRIQEQINEDFEDLASPWSARKTISDAAMAELRFAELEAVRRGDITVEQYDRLVAAIADDRGDGKGELTWAAHTLRIGRTGLVGKAPYPVQLPAFTIRLGSTRNHFQTDFLYVPGHPDGSLRHLPADISAESIITGGIKGNNSSSETLAWLASRMPPHDFRQLLAEFTQNAVTSKVDPLWPVPTGRTSKPVATKEDVPFPWTRWLAEKLKSAFGDAGHVPRVALDLSPPGNRPLRFVDAVAFSQVSRARSTMDPRFVGKLDADTAALEQIAMNVLQESLSVVLLPLPARSLQAVQLAGFLGLMTHRTASYFFSNPTPVAEGTAELLADLVDFVVGVGSTTGVTQVARARLRKGAVHVYSRAGGKRGLWLDADTRRYALAQLPVDAAPRGDGVFAKGNALFVNLDTQDGVRPVRITPDGESYRIRLDDNAAGPLLRRTGATWKLAYEARDVQPSALAALLKDEITTDPATLGRARRLMRQWGVSEREFIAMAKTNEGLLAMTPLVLTATGHAFLETLPARLRDRNHGRWTSRELRQVAPLMAAQIGRPLAIQRADGRLDVAVMPDGTEVATGMAPANALQVRRIGDRYFLPGSAPMGTTRDYPSIFAAVEAGSRPPGRKAADASQRETEFRAQLADTLDARSTRPEHERLLGQWIDPLAMPDAQRTKIKELSRLQHALFDKHHALTAAEENRLLTAIRDLVPAGRSVAIEVRRYRTNTQLAFIDTDPPARHRIVIEAQLDENGSRTAYYRQDSHGDAVPSRPVDEAFSPIIDVLLNAGDGELRKALSRGEWDWRQFADDVLARMADEENALLPSGLGHLVLKDKATLALAKKQASDTWIEAGRQYARLRNLAGRTQVVEVSLTAADGAHEILSPMGRAGRNTGRFLVRRDGKWYPTGRLRGGLDPMDAAGRAQAAASITRRLPAGTVLTAAAMERVLDVVPQPLLPHLVNGLDAVDVVADEGLVLTVRDGQGAPWRYRTMVGPEGIPIAHARPTFSRMPPIPVTRHQEVMPSQEVIQGAAGPTPEHVNRLDRELLDAEAPVSQLLALGVQANHVQALVNARRLRGMLAEDDRMVVVASVSNHSVTLVLPVNERTVQAQGWRTIAALPPGTRIVDSLYGVSSSAADYADHIRAVARPWEAQGFRIGLVRSGGTPATVSPEAFTEQVLSSPVRINVWNPRYDPISEAAYLEYIRYRYQHNILRNHVGLDWLVTREARQDYQHYFAPPFGDILPATQQALANGTQGPGVPMEALLAEVAVLGRQPADASTPAGPPSTTPAVTHDEAVAEFNRWLQSVEPTRPDIDDTWDIDIDLLGPVP